MQFLEASPCHTPLKDAVVLLCVNVERLLVHRGVILDLIYGRLRLARLRLLLLRWWRGLWLRRRKMVLQEEVRGVRDGSRCRRGAWRSMS